MKTISICYVDFLPGFDEEKFLIHRILKQHFNVILNKENPEYVISFAYGRSAALYPSAVHILISFEALSPNWNLYDYAIGWDKMDYLDRFFSMPFGILLLRDPFMLEHRTLVDASLLSNKKHFCNFIYGNSSGQPIREKLFHVISEYNHVESAGTWLNNQEDNLVVSRGKSKDDFQENCKFSIAVDSISVPGFVTEKLFEAYLNHTIPIYYGAPDILEYINPGAIVNVRDYPTEKELLAYIDELNTDDEKLLEVLNTPLLKDDLYVTKKMKDLEEFLIHIFEQDRSEAFRRIRKFQSRIEEEQIATSQKLFKSRLWHCLCRIKSIFMKVKQR